MANESWVNRFQKVSGQIDLKKSGTELFMRRGILMVRDSGCIKVLNNTNTWWTFDRGKVDALGRFQKQEHLKVDPNRSRKLCASFGASQRDDVLYNLTFHSSDPIPGQGGGKTPFERGFQDIFDSMGDIGKSAIGLGLVIGVGFIIYKVIDYKKAELESKPAEAEA